MKRQVRITRNICEQLSKEDLIKMFLIHRGVVLNDTTKIFVRVPGGGDHSNMNLDIDKDTPLCISWTEVEDS